METSVPIVTRWTLYALGGVEGQRIRRPRDPVAAWLLKRHPELAPAFASPSVLAMLRARAQIVDEMIAEELSDAPLEPVHHTAVLAFGAGLDARWYRLRPLRLPGIHHVEVDEPELLRLKDQLLQPSPFARAWRCVHRVPIAASQWPVGRFSLRRHQRVLINLEGVAVRIGVDALQRLLRQLRLEIPHAHVIVDLPGILHTPSERPWVAGSARSRWANPATTHAALLTRAELEASGWRATDERWLAARPELRASGDAACTGMEALRVLRLIPGPLAEHAGTTLSALVPR